MAAASSRIALIPMDVKYQDFFLYSSPSVENGYSYVSRETLYVKVIILLQPISNIEPYRQVAGLKRL